jgi:hypothetical protein
MSTPTLRRQFTVHDYTRMRETGILTEDDRVELYSQPMQGQYTQLNKVLFGNTIQSKTMQQIAFTTEQLFQ